MGKNSKFLENIKSKKTQNEKVIEEKLRSQSSSMNEEQLDISQFKVVKKNDHSCDAVQYAVRHLKNVEVKNPSAKWAMINGGPTLDDYVKGRA